MNKSKIITTNSKSPRNNSPLFKKQKKKNPRDNIWTNHWPVIGINVHEKKRSINLLMAILPRNFSNCILDRIDGACNAELLFLFIPPVAGLETDVWLVRETRSIESGSARKEPRQKEIRRITIYAFEVSNHGARDYSGRKKFLPVIRPRNCSDEILCKSFCDIYVCAWVMNVF